MKTYSYKLRATMIISLFVFVWLFILIRSYRSGQNVWFILSLIGIPLICWGVLLNFFTKVIITDTYARVESKYFMIPRQLNWSDIEIVVDDVLEFLQWCPYLHKFNLIPRRRFGEPPKKWIILTAYFKNYRDLLKEVVSHVSPDTKVDASILKLTGLTLQDIGKLYKPPEQ